MLDTAIAASKSDFVELVLNYKRRHNETLDVPTILQTAQALAYVSESSASGYLREVRDRIKPWVSAKKTLEGLLSGLNGEAPGITPSLLNAITAAAALPEITGLQKAVQDAMAASCCNMCVPFNQSLGFVKLRGYVAGLYAENLANLTKFSEAYAAVEGLKPTTCVQSALEVLESEADSVIRGVADRKRNLFELIKPANAMLYLLETAKAGEKAGVLDLLGSHKQRMIEILNGRVMNALGEATEMALKNGR